MSDASVSAERFVHESRAVLDRVTGSAAVREDVARAAELIAGCVRGDGVVQAFGTGHSQAAPVHTPPLRSSADREAATPA